MAHVAIIGSGIIGRSWAIVAARAGLQARLVIRRVEARAEVAKAILAAVENAMPITPTVPVEEVMKRITFVASLEEAASGAGYVFWRDAFKHSKKRGFLFHIFADRFKNISRP